MKGVELLGSVLAILMLIGTTAFLGSLIMLALNAAKNSPAKPTYSMAISPVYPPIKYEAMLLAYLETTEASGYPIKKLLVYGAYQKNITNISIDLNSVTTLQDSTYEIFSQWMKYEGYILALNAGGDEFVIAENKKSLPIFADARLNIRRVSIPLFIDFETFKSATSEKSRELPLNVTLDLYVQ